MIEREDEGPLKLPPRFARVLIWYTSLQTTGLLIYRNVLYPHTSAVALQDVFPKKLLVQIDRFLASEVDLQ